MKIITESANNQTNIKLKLYGFKHIKENQQANKNYQKYREINTAPLQHLYFLLCYKYPFLVMKSKNHIVNVL